MSRNRDSSKKSARAVKRLEAHNKSPKTVVQNEDLAGDGAHEGRPRGDSSGEKSRSSTRDRSVEAETRRESRSHSRASNRRGHDKSRRRKDSRSRSNERRRHERSRSRNTRSSSRQSEPPAWAREILERQRQNTEELRRLKSGMADKSVVQSSCDASNQGGPALPGFRFEGNKTQYEFNRSVIGHMDRALASNNRDELQREINEGKKALVQRNKHILLAEKYGWDTVKCYTAEPLASDSEDEKKIKRAIKESKALRNEKKASNSRPRVRKPVPSQRQGPSWTNSNPRQVGLYNSATKAADEEIVRCFRCRKPGHIARECRSANARYVIAGAASTSQPLPQS